MEKVKIESGKTVPLSSDIIFKSVFARNEKVLIKMIRDIFEINDISKPFTIVGYETVSPKSGGKVYRGDILLKLSDYSYVLVEMNNGNDPSVIDRNMINLIRIHSQILESGEEDKKLKYYRLKALNFNKFRSENNDPIEEFAICNKRTGKIESLIYTFCNIYLEKCKELVYDIGIDNLPKAVRWGAIMIEEDIEKISEVLGEDMLSMEDKERFIETIREVNEDERLLNDWVIQKNMELKYESQMDYAKEQGISQGIEQGSEAKELEVIKNMLKKQIDYSVISEVTGKTIEEIKKIESDMLNKE